MPTIFSFSNGKEQQPKRRCLVSINEVVSGIHNSAVNSNEEVEYVDSESSAKPCYQSEQCYDDGRHI